MKGEARNKFSRASKLMKIQMKLKKEGKAKRAQETSQEVEWEKA